MGVAFGAPKFLKLKKMNHVNLIGKLNSAPKIVELSTGRKIAQFTLTTSETILNADGSAKNRSSWHRITAWGKWVKVLEEFGNAGIELAV